MMSAFWIIIEEAGVNLGEIRSAQSWESDDPLDRAGRFRFSMPAGDAKARHIRAKRLATCYTIVQSSVAEVGSGVIDKISVSVDSSGAAILNVEGDNRMRELTYRQVGSLSIDDGASGPDTSGPSDIIAYAPAGWSLDTTLGYDSSLKAILHVYEGESVLAAFIRLAEITGEHFRMGSGQSLIWMRTDQPVSGIRAIQGGDPILMENSLKVCLVTDLEKVEDSYELISRVYPYGKGDGATRITLSTTTWTAPGGWTLDTGNNYIKNDAAESQYGQIERYMSWKDVAEADTLAEVAYEWLRRRTAPYESYRLNIAGLKTTLEPGSTIHVIYQRWIDGYHAVDIDTDLLILQATQRIDEKGMRTVGLEVATADRWPETDAEAILSGLEQARNAYTHAQA